MATAFVVILALYGIEVRKNMLLRGENTKTFQEVRDALEKSKQELQTASEKNLEEKNKLMRRIDELTHEKESALSQAEELSKKIALEEDFSKGIVSDIDKLNMELAEARKERAEIAVRMEEGFKKKKKAYDTKILSLESQLQKAQSRLNREADKYHYNLGVFYVRSKDYENAVKEFKAALSYRPENANAHYNLGIIYDDYFKEKEQAKYHYKSYLELSPAGDDADAVREWLANLQR